MGRYVSRRLFLVPVAALALGAGGGRDARVDGYETAAARIVAEATTRSKAWDRVAELTDRFPARLSGSENLAGAIEWVAARLREDGFDEVRTEPVTVPHWRRGEEWAELVTPVRYRLAMLALGGSVGTAAGPIEAPVLVVRSFDDLDARAAEARGRIVLFNVPFDAAADDLLASYRAAARYRGTGASAAAAKGAVAMLLRSVGPTMSRTPHTGGMRYADGQPRIPAAAISAEDADLLQRLQDRGERVTVRLSLGAEWRGEAESANVIAELRGRELPNEVVLIGGHLDSWDASPGASDNAAGCVATWEALRVLRTLNLVPRRTIRLVLFTNEENGLRGGLAYRDRHKGELKDHVLALESDTGVFSPRGFGFTGSAPARAVVAEIAGLLERTGMAQIFERAEAPDLGPLVKEGAVPMMSLTGDMKRYFEVHHTPADTVDKITPAEIAAAAGGIATMAYVVADLPDRLPR
jgi:carboxypeptidase Q